MTQQPQTDSAGNTAAEQRAVSAVLVENAAAVTALLELERRAVQTAAGPIRQALRNLLRLLSTRYVITFGSLEAPADPERSRQLSALLAAELEPLRELDPEPAIREAASTARVLGAQYANRHLPDPVPASEIPVDPAVRRVLAEVQVSVSDAVDKAQRFAQSDLAADWAGVVKQVGVAAQAATSTERQTAWAVAQAHNSAIRSVAVQRGARILWIAEPDACRVCLALSGHLSDPATGQGFDEEATFGKPGSAPSVWPPGHPLMGPPRHIGCRCVPSIWYGPALPEGHEGENSLYNRPGVGAQVDLPAALRREAKRSIVYGWSLPSESGTVRLDAAARLLARGAGLPRSVEARGREAVRRGRFDNRTHPSPGRTAHRR